MLIYQMMQQLMGLKFTRGLKPLNMDQNLVQIHDQAGPRDEGGLF